jgi:serine/threonine-protein kinase
VENELKGRRLGGRYLLESPIASGGMATVWRATDEVLGRSDAVKVLRQDLAEDLDLVERFRLEAVAAARLSHPAVVRVFDTGVDEGICYIVMELHEGTNLADILSDGPLSPAEAARIVRDALQGLAHAHREGVIHRDVKPSNILVDRSGLVKVTDFGIAKAAFAGGDVTTTGNLLGTAKYLAPEQVEGEPVDGRADLYSAGIVLYEALTGRPPFEADNHLATATMRLTAPPRPPGALRPGIPRPLEGVVLRALARQPDERFQTAEEMSAAIDRASPGTGRPAPSIQAAPEPSGRRPSVFRSWMLVPLLLAVVAAFAVGGYLLFRGFAGSPSSAGSGERLQPYEIAGASDYDPEGDNGEEYPDLVPDAFDNDLATAWQTEGYENAPISLSGKSGVGIYFDLGDSSEVGRIRIRTPAPGWRFEIRGSDDAPPFGEPLPGRDGHRQFVARSDTVFVNLEPVSYRYFLIWITELPEEGQPHRAQIAEVDFFPPRG